MKIFVVSKYGSSQDLAKKLIQEGHEALMYIRDKTARNINISPFLVKNPVADMMIDDLFLIEDDMSGKFADETRKLGRPTIGGGLLVDRLSQDRQFMESTVNGCGLKMAGPETKGIPVNLGGWFDGSTFLRPYFLGFRYERVGAGDVGHKTKSMGLAGQYKLKGSIFNTLHKFETLLHTANYQGFVNLNLYINNEIMHVDKLELGLNFPTTSVLCAIHGTMGTFLKKVATATAKQVSVQPDRIGVGVVWLPNIDQATICPTMVCHIGDTIEEASIGAYKDIRKLGNEDAYYRVDIGANYNNHMKVLKKFEWI